MTDIKRMEGPTDQISRSAASPWSSSGAATRKFIACTGYPECTNTREIAQEGVTEQDEREYCENCGRHGAEEGPLRTVLACTGYPDCKTTKQLGAGQKPQDVSPGRALSAVRQ
jgi:DNA topoisomerase-1